MLSVIPNPPRIALPIVGSDDLFPVRRVYCVGRNYAAHAREMGKDPDREPPFFFMKPADALQIVTGDGGRSTIPIRRAPRTTISRSRWWRPSGWAAATSRRPPPSTTSTATRSAST